MICQRSHCHDKHAKPAKTTLSGDPQQSTHKMRLCNGVTRPIATYAFLRINNIEIKKSESHNGGGCIRVFLGYRKDGLLVNVNLYVVCTPYRVTPGAILSLISLNGRLPCETSIKLEHFGRDHQHLLLPFFSICLAFIHCHNICAKMKRMFTGLQRRVSKSGLL